MDLQVTPLFVSRMVECIHCKRSFHKICVLYHDGIWPEGYQCCNCLQRLRTSRKDNRFIAKSKYNICTCVSNNTKCILQNVHAYKTIHAVHVHI